MVHFNTGSCLSLLSLPFAAPIVLSSSRSLKRRKQNKTSPWGGPSELSQACHRNPKNQTKPNIRILRTRDFSHIALRIDVPALLNFYDTVVGREIQQEPLESALYGTLGFALIRSGFLCIIVAVAPPVMFLKAPGIKTCSPALFLA